MRNFVITIPDELYGHKDIYVEAEWDGEELTTSDKLKYFHSTTNSEWKNGLMKKINFLTGGEFIETPK